MLGALCILYDKGPQNLSSWNQKPRTEGTLEDFTILRFFATSFVKSHNLMNSLWTWRRCPH